MLCLDKRSDKEFKFQVCALGMLHRTITPRVHIKTHPFIASSQYSASTTSKPTAIDAAHGKRATKDQCFPKRFEKFEFVIEFFYF